MQLDELLAREAIRDLVARYNANGDTGRFTQVIELFATDAVMVTEFGTASGLDEIMAVFTGTQNHLGEGAVPAYIRHFTATHQIDVIDATSARGRCYFAVLSPVGLDHWGQYVDTYTCVDDRWLFARREVTTLGRAPDSLFPTDPA